MRNPDSNVLEEEQKTEVVVKVFDYSIWLMLFGFILLFAFCFSLITPVIDTDVRSGFKRRICHFARYMIYSAAFLANRDTNQVIVEKEKNYTWKAFYITWQFGAFFIALVYGAAMAASAVLPPSPPAFSTIDHLAAKIELGEMRMVFPTASIAYLAMLSDSRNPALLSIAEAMKKNPPAIAGDRGTESWILEGDQKTLTQYVGWDSRPIWEAGIMQSSCSVTLMDSFIYDPLTIGLAKNDEKLLREINRGIEYMKKIAILEVLKLKYAAPSGCERQKLQESLDRLMEGGFQGTVNVGKIQWSLWTTLWGSLAGCVVFLIEARHKILSQFIGLENEVGPAEEGNRLEEEEVKMKVEKKRYAMSVAVAEAWK